MQLLKDMLKAFSFSDDFVDEISNVPEEFLELEGLSWQLDVVKFTEHFFNNGILNSTIDANANVRSTNVYTYFNEVVKPWSKLYSIYYIYERMKSLFGQEDAKNSSNTKCMETYTCMMLTMLHSNHIVMLTH